ncbi:MAG TPA: hypothetical protein VK981_06865 [Ramlibacter sp.]|nr:hypothetical protein [Ramlibacter sp.]
MTEDEFNAFVNLTMEAFRVMQEDLQAKRGFGVHARWALDPDAGKLELFDQAGRLVVAADVIDIGTYTPDSNTWKWAWANKAVPAEIRARGRELKELAAITGKKLFEADGSFPIGGEPMAWELAALSVRHLRGLGVYKAVSPSPSTAQFLAVTRVTQVVRADH